MIPINHQLEVVNKKFKRYPAPIRDAIYNWMEAFRDHEQTEIHSWFVKCRMMHDIRVIFREGNLPTKVCEWVVEYVFGYSKSSMLQYSRIYETFQDLSPEVLERIPKTAVRKAVYDADFAVKLIKEAMKLKDTETLCMQTCNDLMQDVIEEDEKPKAKLIAVPPKDFDQVSIEDNTFVERSQDDPEPDGQAEGHDDPEPDNTVDIDRTQDKNYGAKLNWETEQETTDDKDDWEDEEGDDDYEPEEYDAEDVKKAIVDEAEKRFRFYSAELDLEDFPGFSVSRRTKQQVNDLAIQLLGVIHECVVEESHGG